MTDDAEAFRQYDPRTDAREQAVMLLYESEQRSVSPLDLMVERGVASEDMARALLEGVEASRAHIDSEIVTHARGWALDRMPALDRAILRLAIHELLDRPDVPVAVVIDEAVELAKRFSTDDSGRFVNGVLAAVAKTSRPSAE
ncbi:MAG: transcription antitermination factor NusB [Acidimicrobiaceae bacterium]|jgi:N utilization substance protein B|nr:transcription antitermination factor NusB [Ilumatobacteraceae bacterium]